LEKIGEKGGKMRLERIKYFLWALWRYKICYYIPCWKYLREDEKLFRSGLWE